MLYNPPGWKNALATAWLVYPLLLSSVWLFGPLLLELATKLGQPFGYWESPSFGAMLLTALHLCCFRGHSRKRSLDRLVDIAFRDFYG